MKKIKTTLALWMLSLIFQAQAQTPATVAPQYENPWFQILSNYEPVLTPITGALVCGSIAGLPGAAAGFIVGTIDETLIYYGYTSEKHLTMGLLVSSMANTLHGPYYIAETLGFGIGFGLSTGAIKAETSQLAGPVSAAMAGASYSNAKGLSGISGLLMGSAAFLVDHAGWYKGDHLCHYLNAQNTAAVVAPTISYLISAIPIIGSTLSPAITANFLENNILIILIALNEKNEINSNLITEKITTPEALKSELDKIITRVTGPDVIAQITKQQVTYKIGTSILVSLLGRKISEHNQNFLHRLGSLAPGKHAAQATFNSAIVTFGVFLVPYITHSLFNSVVTDYQSNKLELILKESILKTIMDGEAPLYLKAESGLDSDVKNFDRNLNTIAAQGIQVIWSTTDTYTTAIHSSLMLFRNDALDVVTFLASYSSVIETLVGTLTNKQDETLLKIEQLTNKKYKLEGDIKQLPKLIINGRKLAFLKEKIIDLEAQLRQLNAEKYNYGLLLSGITTAQGITNQLISFSLISRKSTSGGIKTSSIFSSNNAANNLLSSGNWYLKNQGTIKIIQRSQDSLNRVLDYLDQPCDEKSSMIVTTQKEETNSIQLSHFRIGLVKNDQELLISDNIEIPAGRYVVTGKSGSGKSSFLSKIRGIKCNGIYAQGNISYKTKDGLIPEVYEVTQEDYIAPYSSLIEVLTGKTSIQLAGNDEIRTQARDLLIRLKLDDLGLEGIAGKLEEEKSWGDTLSGGQKRKIAIAALLLKRPSFVILDETFAGLDGKSIQLVQALILEFLGDAVILVVDHQPDANNYDGFYQQRLHLEDQKLSLIPIEN